MSETECQYCGGRYIYPPEELRADGTVFCRYCGNMTMSGIGTKGRPAAKFLTSLGECAVTIIVIILGQLLVGFIGSAIPYEAYVGFLVVFVVLVAFAFVRERKKRLEQAYSQDIGTST